MCSKCVMRRGREEPCVSNIVLQKLQADPKRICPRIDLDEDNRVAGEVAWFAVRLGGDHPLFHKLFDLHTASMDHDSTMRFFYRVIAAVSDPGVAARIKAERERAMKSRE